MSIKRREGSNPSFCAIKRCSTDGGAFFYIVGRGLEPERSEGIAALRRRGRMKQGRNFRSRAVLRVEALCRDPQTANAARRIKSLLLRQKSTLILIESGYFSFCQKLQYFWAFSRFKADLGCSRDRPFLCLCGFSAILARTGFVGLFLGFVGFMGKFAGILRGSLVCRANRWNIG